MEFFDNKNLEAAKLDRVAKELELHEATNRAIELAKEFTTRLEMEKPVTRCLVAHAINKVYYVRFPKVYEALRKLGV